MDLCASFWLDKGDVSYVEEAPGATVTTSAEWEVTARLEGSRGGVKNHCYGHSNGIIMRSQFSYSRQAAMHGWISIFDKVVQFAIKC